LEKTTGPLFNLDGAIEEYNEHLLICVKCRACSIPPSEDCPYGQGLRDGIAAIMQVEFDEDN
jgi:hypothetical protein